MKGTFKMKPKLQTENEELLEKLNALTDEVFVSYSGKPGCMCGCNGKYSYKESMRKWASKSRGYEIDDDEISDVAVKRMINKFKKLLSNPEIVTYCDDYGDEGHFFYKTDTRYNAIYFRVKK